MTKLIPVLLITLILTGCAQASATPQPQPTQPTADFPTMAVASMPACTVADLAGSANSDQANGAVTIGVTLTNKSTNNCSLANPPVVSLLDQASQSLDVKISQSATEPAIPAQGLIPLAPGDNVIATLVWRNYCKTLPGDVLDLRLALAGGQSVDVRLVGVTVPHCDAIAQPSSAELASYSSPP